MVFFHSLPVPELREWVFSIPFPFPNFGNGIIHSLSRSRTPKCHSRSPLGKKEKPKKAKVQHSFQLSLENENKKIGGVSALVDIMEEKGRGRFAIAKYAQLSYSLSLFYILREEIAPGTVLAAGGPGMAFFNPDDPKMMLKFCLHCLRATEAPLPCLTCTSVVFCSSQCRTDACSSYHKYQCQIDLYSHRQHDTGGALDLFLPLKAVWEITFSVLRQQWDENGDLKRNGNSEFQRLWSMVTHEKERTIPGLVKVAVIAIFLLRCSRLTSYLGKPLELNEPLSAEEEWLGSILARLYMIQDMNAHPLFGVDNGQSQREVIDIFMVFQLAGCCLSCQRWDWRTLAVACTLSLHDTSTTRVRPTL